MMCFEKSILSLSSLVILYNIHSHKMKKIFKQPFLFIGLISLTLSQEIPNSSQGGIPTFYFFPDVCIIGSGAGGATLAGAKSAAWRAFAAAKIIAIRSDRGLSLDKICRSSPFLPPGSHAGYRSGWENPSFK